MKDWLPSQIDFVSAHLQIDMSADDLGRLFMVNPAEIWQLSRAKKMARNWSMSLTGLHTPGGGTLLSSLGIRGATQADAYEPWEFWAFQNAHRPVGWISK